MIPATAITANPTNIVGRVFLFCFCVIFLILLIRLAVNRWIPAFTYSTSDVIFRLLVLFGYIYQGTFGLVSFGLGCVGLWAKKRSIISKFKVDKWLFVSESQGYGMTFKVFYIGSKYPYIISCRDFC